MPIGSAMLMQAGNNLVTMADGSVWLRTGVLAQAASYPLAAQREHLRAHSFGSISPGGSGAGTVRRVATDGAGRYMIADGDTAYVRMSSDYGATWSNVAHGMATAATDVAYAGGTWLVVSNTTAQLYANDSTNGTSFIGAYTIGTSGGSQFQADSAQIAHSGTLFYVAIGGSDTANNAWSSPTAASGTWTNRSVSATFGTSGFGLGAGGGKALISITGTPTMHRCTDGGSFASTTAPSSPATAARPAYIAGAFIVFFSSSSYFYTTDSVAFAQYSSPTGCAIGYQWALTGGRLVYLATSNSGISYTADGLTWDYQSTSISAGGALSDGFAMDTQTMIYQPSGSATGYRAASSIASSNYVGRSMSTYASGNQQSNPFLYYRIK